MQDEDNDNLQPILKSLSEVRWVNSTVKMNGSFTLASIMPTNTETYYTYKGSLTTPPCNEAVTWIIFSTPVQISFKQVFKKEIKKK